jgi:hypothetical protein
MSSRTKKTPAAPKKPVAPAPPPHVISAPEVEQVLSKVEEVTREHEPELSAAVGIIKSLARLDAAGLPEDVVAAVKLVVWGYRAGIRG